MAILRDVRAVWVRLFARSNGERAQSLTEYVLILAVVMVAGVAVLGMVSPSVSSQLDPVTTALGGEGEKSAFRVPAAMLSWIAIAVLVVGAIGVYVLKMRRR